MRGANAVLSLLSTVTAFAAPRAFTRVPRIPAELGLRVSAWAAPAILSSRVPCFSPCQRRAAQRVACGARSMVQGVVVEDGCILDLNPSTGALIEKVRCSTPEEVKAAVAAARDAQPTWEGLGLAKRHEVLDAAMSKFGELPGGIEGLATLITQEMGKVIAEARDEVEGAIDKENFLKLVRGANEDEVIDVASGTTVVRDPHGVVAVIAPWNFPADEILILALPALMAGNTVVVKPSEVTPLVGKAVVEQLQQALPAGVLNLLQGDGEVGKLLVTNPGVDMIGFTGSCQTGTHVISHDTCARACPGTWY